MKQIWKYQLTLDSKQTFDVPEGTKPLSVQIQKGLIQLWAEVDSSSAPVEMEVYVVGTGESFDFDADFLGTFQQFNGAFIGHVYVRVS